MRKLVADMIISLDGYFTSLKNEIDWFDFDADEWVWSSEILRRADAMLYGRVTYEEFRQFWPSDRPKKIGADPYLLDRLNVLQKIVFSRTLTDTPWKPARLVREEPGKAVAALKREPGKDMVLVGSGTLFSALLRDNLIDEYFIRVRPIILGAGRPLFTDPKTRHPLKLASSKDLQDRRYRTPLRAHASERYQPLINTHLPRFISNWANAIATELPVQSPSQPSPGRNLEAPPWCYLLWGVPALMVSVSFGLRSASTVSLTEAGTVWVVAVAWAGIGCYLNGRSCGRVHCRIDGIGFPVLAIIGALNLLSIISFSWNWFWLAFIVILVVSFLPELTWKRYA